MKRQSKKYRLTLEDESRLAGIWSARFSRAGMVAFAAGVVLVLGVIVFCAVAFTPLRSLLPGHLNTGERQQILRGLMRIDSLEEGYRKREGYVRNVLAILDSGRPAAVAGSRRMPVNTEEPDADLLAMAGDEERAFVRMMEEREKYNLSVLNPEAPDGLLFVKIAPGSVVGNATSGSTRAEVILPLGSGVNADADGTVTGCRYSSQERGYEIEIHHARGYMSRYYGLGTPLVRKGERVSAGQAIAAPADRRGIGRNRIGLEIWRDGEAMIPARLIYGD